MALANLKKDTSVEADGDSVGGGGVLPSAVYLMTIVAAYFGESTGGAASLNLELKTKEGKTLRNTVYISSSRAKGQSITYQGKDGKPHFLPGFSLATSLTELLLGTEIADVATAEKQISLYNYLAKKEEETKVNMLVDLLDKQIAVGVIECRSNKNTKNAAGAYAPDPSGADRTYNEIDKFFNASGLTITEQLANAAKPGFLNTWKDKWDGNKRDDYVTPVANGTAGAPVASEPENTAQLFT